MGKFALLLVLMALLVVKSVKAQEENVLEEVVRDLLEDMAIDGRLSENGDEAEDLYAIADNKIDINSATADELRSLHVLKEAQIQSIIEERNKMGAFTSVLDLLMLKDFDDDSKYNPINKKILASVHMYTPYDLRNIPRRKHKVHKSALVL